MSTKNIRRERTKTVIAAIPASAKGKRLAHGGVAAKDLQVGDVYVPTGQVVESVTRVTEGRDYPTFVEVWFDDETMRTFTLTALLPIAR